MRYMELSLPFVILIDCIVFLNFFLWHNESVYEFQQRQMDIQANYAVDAAAQAMLESTTDIYLDYSDWYNISVDPVVALDTFEAMMCRNYGWAPTDENKKSIEDYGIPFFVVATYDGYYGYIVQEQTISVPIKGTSTNVNSYNHFWTPKLPYSYTIGETIYALNLKDNTCIKVTKDSLSVKQNFPKGDNERLLAISNHLTNICNEGLVTALEWQGGSQDVVYIQPTLSSYGNSNAVTGPSVLTYVTKDYGWVGHNQASFAIGGSKIDNADYQICYSRGGKKLYTSQRNIDVITSSHIPIEHIYDSASEAAENGYYYDLSFLN